MLVKYSSKAEHFVPRFAQANIVCDDMLEVALVSLRTALLREKAQSDKSLKLPEMSTVRRFSKLDEVPAP